MLYLTTMIHADDEFSESCIATFEITEQEIQAIGDAAKFLQSDGSTPFIKISKYATVAEIWNLDCQADTYGDLSDELYDGFLITHELPNLPELKVENSKRYDFSHMEIWKPYGGENKPYIGFVVYFKHDHSPFGSLAEINLKELEEKWPEVPTVGSS